MSRISRLVILVASMAAVVSAMAGTASAVTWDVTGPGSFTATAPAGTLSATSVNLACAAGAATGSYTAGSISGAVYSGVSGTIAFTGCLLAGQASSVDCGYRLTASAQPTPTTVTTGNADVTCAVTISGIKNCHINGQAHVIYTDNAASADTLTVTTSSSLTIGGPSCLAGANEPAHLNETRFVVTSNGGNGPHIVRTG